jgi:hypothetical protein
MGFNGHVESALQDPSAALSQILAAERQLEGVQKAVVALEERHLDPPGRTSASASLDRELASSGNGKRVVVKEDDRGPAEGHPEAELR